MDKEKGIYVEPAPEAEPAPVETAEPAEEIQPEETPEEKTGDV